MKFKGLCFFITAICLSATLSPSWAAGNKGVRACLTSDLIGVWDMQSINTKVKLDPNSSFGWPYQRFSFDRRGDVKEMMSTTPIAGDKAAMQKFENAASTSKFSLDERGILSISKIESPEPEHCACSIAIKEVPAEMLAKLPEAKRALIPHQGDLILTYMSRGNKPVVIKSLRRV